MEGTTSECGLPTSPKKMSQTEQQLEIAKKNSGFLADCISKLEIRLSPALRPEELKELSGKEEVDGLIDIARAVKNLGNHFSVSAKRINSVIERLEI